MQENDLCLNLNDRQGNINDSLSLINKEPPLVSLQPIQKDSSIIQPHPETLLPQETQPQLQNGHSDRDLENNEEQKIEETKQENSTIPFDIESDILNESQGTVMEIVNGIQGISIESPKHNEVQDLLKQQEIKRMKARVNELINDLRLENYDELLELLQTIVKLDPTDWEAYYEMGSHLLKIANRQKNKEEILSQARDSFKKVAEITIDYDKLKHDPKKENIDKKNISSAYIHLAKLYFNNIDQLEHLFVLRPQPIYMYIALLTSYYKHGKYLKAISTAINIIHKDQTEDLPYVMLVHSLLKLRLADKKELEEGFNLFSGLLKDFASDLTVLKCLSAVVDISGEAQNFYELFSNHTPPDFSKVPPKQQEMEEKMKTIYKEPSLLKASDILGIHSIGNFYKGKLLSLYEQKGNKFVLKS